MNTETDCELILDVLAEAGARQIFGETGDAPNPFLEATRGDERLQWIGAQHGDDAACSQSVLSGTIGVRAGTVGRGTLHCVCPGEIVMPPHIEARQACGFGISKLREAALGVRGDHAQWENWQEELR